MSVTLLNKAVCAFIIPGVGEGSSLDGLVAPGGTITVTDSVADTDFVRNLIEIGDLEEAESLTGDDVLGQLREKAVELGIEVNEVWKEARLRKEIAKAQAAQ